VQAEFLYVLGLSQFSTLPQLPQKMMLGLKKGQNRLENKGKAINIEYGKIDFENDIIETVTSTRL